MAIESDQLVFDYLSRVGDLAQQRQLPSKTRMRLVTELRAEIERRRTQPVAGKTPGNSPAAVRRILARLGTPEEVVTRAAGSAGGSAEAAGPAPDVPLDVPPKPSTKPSVKPRTKPSAQPGGKSGAADGTAGAHPAPDPAPDSAPDPAQGPVPFPFSYSSLFTPSAPTPPPASPPTSPPAAEPAEAGPEVPLVPPPRAEEPAPPAGGTSGATGAAGGAGDTGGTGEKAPRRRLVPRPRFTKDAAPPAAPPPPANTPPHLAGEDELGPSDAQPDWWRTDDSPFSLAASVPGFVGGVEIPEILKPPKEEDEEEGAGDEKKGEAEADSDADGDEGAEPSGRRRLFPLRRARAARSGLALTNPLLLLAAVALVVGAVTGELIAFGIGWGLAYTSRRLTQRESKFAVLGIPGTVAAAGLVWLWGRFSGRWGEAVPKDGTADALVDTGWWVVRVAAVASALFLVWRSQRRRAE